LKHLPDRLSEETVQNLPQVVYAVIWLVAEEESIPVDTLRDESRLVDDLGLKSLDLARVVAKLELTLGVDPFAQLVPITSIRTVGDLCAAYARCLSPAAGNVADSPSADILAGKARAAARGRATGFVR
jgi:acyl carrier protein